MKTSPLLDTVRRRVSRAGDDSGSLMFAMLIIIVGTLLSSLMIPMMITQMSSTRSNNREVHELDAAEAGIDVAMAQIRAANDNAGNGVLSRLPCNSSTGQAFTGPVGVGGTSRYQVSITYYKTDPQGQTAAWLTANQVTCITGGGTLSAPAYALLQSQGIDSITGTFGSAPLRTLLATYIFRTTNINIPGGPIHVYKTSTSNDLCLDAGSSSPTAGTNVTVKACSTGSTPQKFAYNANLTLVLVTSKTQLQPLGMCLDAGTPHAVGNVVKFQACATVTHPQQQWSFNDEANLEGTSDGKTLDGFCFNVQTPNATGSFVVLANGSNCRGAYDNIQTFSPDAAVGAGAAGASSGQLVNFNEFGRCLDVTEQNVTYGYLIAWPCKQAPDPTNVTWNQRYALPTVAAGTQSGTGRITTNPPAGLYCLQSPLATTSGKYVTVVPCPTGNPANQTWTVYLDTGVYATSYVIRDSSPIKDSSGISGYCLQPTDPNATPADRYPNGNNISKIVVATCNGSTLQKWNADPNILQPLPLKDIHEK